MPKKEIKEGGIGHAAQPFWGLETSVWRMELLEQMFRV